MNMEESTDEYNFKEEENTSQSRENEGIDSLQKDSAEDEPVVNVTDKLVAADSNTVCEQSVDSPSSSFVTDTNDDSVLSHEQPCQIPLSTHITELTVDGVVAHERSNDILPNADNVPDTQEQSSSPPWREQSSDVSSSDDSNANETNESVDKMETENTFEIETSPTKKEITIDMNPLTESDLLSMENDESDSDISDNDTSKNDSYQESQKSLTNSSKVNCTDDDSMSLDAENSDVKSATNEGSVQSENLDSTESEKTSNVIVKEEDSDGMKSEELKNVDADRDNDTKDFIGKVNTDLPNTELSNVDLSAFEVDEPSNKVVIAQSAPMETDLLDELSDFFGFDRDGVQESVKVLREYRLEYDQLSRALENKFFDDDADNVTDNSEGSSSGEWRSDEEVNDRTPSAIATESLDRLPPSAGAPLSQVLQTSAESSAVPSVLSDEQASAASTIFHKSTGNFVYALAKSVNIFEEQVPCGSKRVKKKRKFFGYDEGDEGSSRRALAQKDSEGAPKMINISSENKENVITADIPKEECISENEPIISAPVLPPSEPQMQPKPPTVQPKPSTVQTKPPSMQPKLPTMQPKPPTMQPKPPTVQPKQPTVQPKPPPMQPKPPPVPSKIPVKPKRSAFDVSKPLYKEPFKHGWRREIFYRDLPEGSKSKTAYISYFNPQNKKFKTIRQIVEHLPSGSELNMANFTFSKERIFRDNEPGSEHEIVRYQKDIIKELNNSDFASPAMSLLNRLKTIGGSSTPGHDVSKSKSSKKSKSKGDDSDDEGVDALASSTSKMTMPKILIRGVGQNTTKTPSIKSKLSSSKSSSSQKKVNKTLKKSLDKSFKSKGSLNDDMDAASSDYDDNSMSYSIDSVGSSLVAQNLKNARRPLTCSMSCPLALGHPPTLQCVNCLGLFHYQCCGFDTGRPITNFLCQKCRHLEDTAADAASTCTSFVSEASNSQLLVGGHNSVERSMVAAAAAAAAPLWPPKQVSTKIVDGVTTWMPSSSNIQLSSSSSSLTTLSKTAQLHVDLSASNGGDRNAALLQSVLELDGRRYIIVPKESIVSISPNTNATISTTYAGAGAAEYEHQQLLLQQQQQSAERVDDAGWQCAPSADGVSNASSIPNSAFLNSSSVVNNHSNNNNHNVNSTGVLLVPVMPSGSNVARSSPMYYARDARGGHVGYAACETNVYGSNSLKRRHSNDSDSSMRRAKMARLDADADQCGAYHSSLTLSNISFLYEPLILCFKYLTVKELLRVSMSCKYLNRLASDSTLWSTVRLKNSKITDWDGFARTLRKHRTKRLDMWKMLCPASAEDITAMWDDFCRVIPSITSLERIDLMRCPTLAVQTAAEKCHNLRIINALQLKNDGLSLDSFTKLKHLRELRLKGFPSIEIESSDKLKFIHPETLQVLSLTNLKNLDMTTLGAVSRLRNLRVLELGECEMLSTNFTDILSHLKRLERLRLENVINLDPSYHMFTLLKDLKHFRSLELINFEVKIGFDEALAQCHNLEEFLLIPLYKTQSATTNKVIVNGIQTLSKTLKKFVWGLTTELLRVTDIFVQEYQVKTASKTDNPSDTNNGNKVMAKKGQADSIPVLKRLSEHVEKPEIDILTISQLELLLESLLPAARVKVLKIPFTSTGRQSLLDCFK